jgi:hypothetical protein
METTIIAICPKCHKDDMIQKVSSICAAGTASGSFSGPISGMASPIGSGNPSLVGGYTSGSVYTTTALANTLMPPQVPKQRNPSGLYSILGVWGFLGFIILLFLAFNVYGTYKPLGILYFLGGCFWLTIGILASRKVGPEKIKSLSEFQKQTESWHKANTRWDASYYCYRDDIVFDPQTGKECKIQNFNNFLYTDN